MILPVPRHLEQGGRTGEGKAARPPLDADGPGAPAVRADLRCGPWLTAGAVAGVTLLGAVQVDLLLAAEGGLLKGDGEAGPQALSLLGAIAPASGGPEAPSAEAAAKKEPNSVAQVNVSKV